MQEKRWLRPYVTAERAAEKHLISDRHGTLSGRLPYIASEFLNPWSRASTQYVIGLIYHNCGMTVSGHPTAMWSQMLFKAFARPCSITQDGHTSLH